VKTTTDVRVDLPASCVLNFRSSDHNESLAHISEQLRSLVGAGVAEEIVTLTPHKWRVVMSNGEGVSICLSIPAVPGAFPQGTLTVSATADMAGTSDCCQQLMAEFMRLPFTTREMSDTTLEMPITASIDETWPNKPLDGVGILITIHHMRDFLVLVKTLTKLGVDSEDITVIDKQYPYEFSHRVDAHLTRQFGIRVGKYADLMNVVSGHVLRMERRNRRSIIMDDGGYIIPVLMESLQDTLGHWVGAVEQTISGIRRVEKYRLPFPLFSVAESELKGAIESYGIADAAVRNVIRLLPHEKFEGQPALVLGFGRIGTEVARSLRSRRMRVAVFDRSLSRLLYAHEEGFLTGKELNVLLRSHRPMIIFGSAGRRSFTGENIPAIMRDTYLVSTTSRDYEFALEEIREASSEVVSLGITGTRYLLNRGPSLTALGHGMPINFHFAESLPNRYVDVVMASLVTGAVAIASNDERLREGENVKATNEILEGSGIIERYYDTYGPKWLTNE